MPEQGSCLLTFRDRIHRALAYFSVLRPSFIFGFVIIYLPLTALSEWVPGNLMLGNLFVEYGFWKAFWFSFAFFGAVWALMLTTCLSLDFARDRQADESLALRAGAGREPWLPDPGPNARQVTIPMRDLRSFIWFSLIALPSVAIVIWRAEHPFYAASGLTLGCLLAFLAMNQVAAFVYAVNQNPVLPWRPFGFKIKWIAQSLLPLFTWTMQLAPREIFDRSTGKLKDDHFFAALSATAVVCIYTAIYWFFKPSGFIHFPLENIPPAGFIYALLLPLIWIVAALWAYLSRYRLVFIAVALGTALLTWLATIPAIESTIGGPSHTYDVVPRQTTSAPTERRNGKNMIVVAASGGGILAAGWTTQVLTQVHRAYADFPKELALISSVSGGSVGAAHYLNALDEIVKLPDGIEREVALAEVADDAMRSSLAASAYGFAFADFKRILLPFHSDEGFDRARLLEADWRRIGNCRRAAIGKKIKKEGFQDFCRTETATLREQKTWISATQTDADGKPAEKPLLIFNSTVMETGERIAITPLLSLKDPAQNNDGQPSDVARHTRARTLSEFLNNITTSSAPDLAKQKSVKPTTQSCSEADFAPGYDIDLWTAARLSATFSYVSPAARAACLDPKTNTRRAAARSSLGRLHLIDGGYHDNYGVASALDWLTAQHASQADQNDTRVALIEIRAKADIPTEQARTEWSSAWLGPFWGLLNSWGFAQISTNDTAVDRLIRFEDRLRQRNVCVRSFVFVPETSGPLSWHLSEIQKDALRQEWSSEEKKNKKTLANLIAFLDRKDTTQGCD